MNDKSSASHHHDEVIRLRRFAVPLPMARSCEECIFLNNGDLTERSRAPATPPKVPVVRPPSSRTRVSNIDEKSFSRCDMRVVMRFYQWRGNAAA